MALLVVSAVQARFSKKTLCALCLCGELNSYTPDRPNVYGKKPILPILIICLLLLPAIGNSTEWRCVADDQGGWACYDLAEGSRPAPAESGPAPEDIMVPTTSNASATPVGTTPRPRTREVTVPAEQPAPQPAATGTPHDEQTPAAPPDAVTEQPGARAAPPAPQKKKLKPPPAEADAQPAEAPATAAIVPLPTDNAAAPPPTGATPTTPQPAVTTSTPPLSDGPGAEPIPQLIRADQGSTIDRGLNWAQCYPWPRPAPLSFESPAGQSMVIDADGATLRRQADQVLFSGKVVVRNDRRLLEADQVTYDRGKGTLDAQGNIYFEQPRMRLTAEQARFELDNDRGELNQVAYRLTDQGAQGAAARARLDNPDQTHMEQITYSTCAPGSNGWQLEADELDLDRASGVGTARHAKLRFKGVPFLYLPYASFPIDDRRKSGFLAPSLGSGDRTGLDLAVPYYFNIAPELDAIFTPRHMSQRGLLLGGELRYLQPRHRGRIRAEILPDDKDVAADENSTRGAFSYQANGRPAPRWGFDVNLNYVSDKRYLDDLGNSLAVTSARQLERRADITYAGNGWNMLGRTQYFQTIDPNIADVDRPYIRLPQLLFDLNRPDQALGLTYLLRGEYVNFDHSNDTKVKGDRIDLMPGIALPMTRPWGFFTPRASLRYTQYLLDNQQPAMNDNPDRALGTLSLDGGLLFERNSNWFDSALVQTLEPRLFYLYTPYVDQSELPDFDSAFIDFSFASLFRENRFSGSDRVGDANQLTAALTSRTLSESTGQELFRASIGQIYYFRDRLVQLPGVPVMDDSSSPLVAELAARMGRNWSTRASIQWNPHKDSDATEKGALSLHYRDDHERIANLSYRMTDRLVEQTDLSGRWPLSGRVSLVGRWTYSLLNDVTNLAFAGFEYDNCCWRVRLIAQQLLTSIDDEPSNSVLLQFELKGLASLGQRVDDYLQENIAGYHAN